MGQKAQIEGLAMKLEKQKNMFEIVKFQGMGKRYEEVATGKFRPQMREDAAIKALEEARTQNAIVEEVLDSIRKENP